MLHCDRSTDVWEMCRSKEGFMSVQSQTPTFGQATIDRYESTFVVSQDISKGDFTSAQPAIDALPAAGGKIFVKAGVYPLSNSIRVASSNIQIQGEGMGITNFVADSGMTGNTPALEAFNPADRLTKLQVVVPAKRGFSATSILRSFEDGRSIEQVDASNAQQSVLTAK